MMLRGTHHAAGFILDVPTIGEDAARGRVLDHWSADASLHALPDERWLLLLGEPLTVRAEHAPGLPVGPELAERRHGRVVRHTVADLQRLDPADWLARPDTIVELRPLVGPPVTTALVRAESAKPPDLRKLAKVPVRPESRRVLAAASGPPRPSRLTKLVLKSRLRDAVARRHQNYLEKLTRAFERGDYENALRDAIALGGDSLGDWLSLRLPTRFRGKLTPGARAGGGAGGVMPWGFSIGDHLEQLYKQAAERLEKQGEFERAAYVHADLLRNARDAVALLERHGLYALAAQLAETRELDADLVVRLWWRAGERRRAITIATQRDAWDSAVERLERVDEALALEFRGAWVEYERGRGAHRAAIDAAWPAETLRAGIGPDLALRALGGVISASALGLELAWRPDPRRTDEALALLAPDPDPLPLPQAATWLPPNAPEPPLVDTSRVDERLALLEVLAEHRAADPTADHRLAAQGVRSLLRDAVAHRVRLAEGGRRHYTQLVERADPLLRVDLPPFPGRGPALSVAEYTAHAERGALTIYDAVLLPAGILVATGGRGVFLLTRHGRVAARWDVPAERLVIADHGASALIDAGGEQVLDLHRLDLITRKITRIGAIAGHAMAESYDGGHLVAVTPDGIEGIDLTVDPPQILWTELNRNARVLDLHRDEDHLSAIVDVRLRGFGDRRSLERWLWALPSRQLREREVHSDDWHDAVTTANGVVIWVAEVDDHLVEWRYAAFEAPKSSPVGDRGRILVSGSHSALLQGTQITLRGARQQPAAVVDFPGGEAVSFRVHGDIATAWTADGRIVAVDLVTRELVARIRTR